MDQFRQRGESFSNFVVKQIWWTVDKGVTIQGWILTLSKCVYWTGVEFSRGQQSSQNMWKTQNSSTQWPSQQLGHLVWLCYHKKGKRISIRYMILNLIYLVFSILNCELFWERERENSSYHYQIGLHVSIWQKIDTILLKANLIKVRSKFSLLFHRMPLLRRNLILYTCALWPYLSTSSQESRFQTLTVESWLAEMMAGPSGYTDNTEMAFVCPTNTILRYQSLSQTLTAKQKINVGVGLDLENINLVHSLFIFSTTKNYQVNENQFLVL